MHAFLRRPPRTSLLDAHLCGAAENSCAGRAPRLRSGEPMAPFFKAQQWSTLTAADALSLVQHVRERGHEPWLRSSCPDEHFEVRTGI